MIQKNTTELVYGGSDKDIYNATNDYEGYLSIIVIKDDTNRIICKAGMAGNIYDFTIDFGKGLICPELMLHEKTLAPIVKRIIKKPFNSELSTNDIDKLSTEDEKHEYANENGDVVAITCFHHFEGWLGLYEALLHFKWMNEVSKIEGMNCYICTDKKINNDVNSMTQFERDSFWGNTEQNKIVEVTEETTEETSGTINEGMNGGKRTKRKKTRAIPSTSATHIPDMKAECLICVSTSEKQMDIDKIYEKMENALESIQKIDSSELIDEACKIQKCNANKSNNDSYKIVLKRSKGGTMYNFIRAMTNDAPDTLKHKSELQFNNDVLNDLNELVINDYFTKYGDGLKTAIENVNGQPFPRTYVQKINDIMKLLVGTIITFDGQKYIVSDKYRHIINILKGFVINENEKGEYNPVYKDSVDETDKNDFITNMKIIDSL